MWIGPGPSAPLVRGRTSSSRVRFALPSPSPAVPTRRPQRGLGGLSKRRLLRQSQHVWIFVVASPAHRKACSP